MPSSPRFAPSWMSFAQRGDIVVLRGRKAAVGHEQRGQRYGVVIQSDAATWLSTVLVAPTSASAQATSFRPRITIRGRKTRVLVEQMSAVDREQIGSTAGRLGLSELRDIEDALRDVLGLF